VRHMTEIDLTSENIENTFIPNAVNKKLSINGIVAFIKIGLCKIDDLPLEVKKLVMDEIKKRRNSTNLEAKLYKTTIFEAQKSGGPWFIITGGELGTLPGRKDHADIMYGLTEDSEIENQSVYP